MLHQIAALHPALASVAGAMPCTPHQVAHCVALIVAEQQAFASMHRVLYSMAAQHRALANVAGGHCVKPGHVHCTSLHGMLQRSAAQASDHSWAPLLKELLHSTVTPPPISQHCFPPSSYCQAQTRSCTKDAHPTQAVCTWPPLHATTTQTLFSESQGSSMSLPQCLSLGSMAEGEWRLPIDAPMLSWVRMRLLEDAEIGMALATVRAALLLCGVRGVEGMRWLSKELVSPEIFPLLTSSLPGTTEKVLHAITRGHEREVVRRGETGSPVAEARKFSQHRQGRHAGQSGKWWLDAAATEVGCANFCRSVSAVLVALPVFGWKQPQQPSVMTDQEVADILRAPRGVFPFAREQVAADYTAMDVGRTLFLVGMFLRHVVPRSLGPSSFEVFSSCQSPNTRKLWADCGIDSHEAFCFLEDQIREAMAAAAVVKLLPMPEKYPAAVMVSWGCVASHICEYKQTCNEEGGAEKIKQVVNQLPTAAEAKLIAHTTQALADGGCLRSHSRSVVAICGCEEVAGVSWPFVAAK